MATVKTNEYLAIKIQEAISNRVTILKEFREQYVLTGRYESGSIDIEGRVTDGENGYTVKVHFTKLGYDPRPMSLTEWIFRGYVQVGRKSVELPDFKVKEAYTLGKKYIPASELKPIIATVSKTIFGILKI